MPIAKNIPVLENIQVALLIVSVLMASFVKIIEIIYDNSVPVNWNKQFALIHVMKLLKSYL